MLILKSMPALSMALRDMLVFSVTPTWVNIHTLPYKPPIAAK
jgi:hypothetical protein